MNSVELLENVDIVSIKYEDESVMSIEFELTTSDNKTSRCYRKLKIVSDTGRIDFELAGLYKNCDVVFNKIALDLMDIYSNSIEIRTTINNCLQFMYSRIKSNGLLVFNHINVYNYENEYIFKNDRYINVTNSLDILLKAALKYAYHNYFLHLT